MCDLWELNPQSFALLTQGSTTEPQEHIKHAQENTLTECIDGWRL